MKHYVVIFIVISFAISGCATLMKGYESEVNVYNISDSVEVFTSYGNKLTSSIGWVEKKVYSPRTKTTIKYMVEDSTVRRIYLRSNVGHVLVFKEGEREYRQLIYPKINAWWFFTSVILGGVPAIVDALTGNWNVFDDVDYQSLKRLYDKR